MITQNPSRILVVDDNAVNVEFLEAMLHVEGYTTLSARDGHDALAAADAELPDLILLDILMPGLDGFETVTRLKSNPKTQRIPVIMVTSLDDRESKLRALQAGAEEFLTKPYDRADLSVRVRNLLRLKEYNVFLEQHNQILELQVQERTLQLEEAHLETVMTLVRAAEHKDEETGHHVRRISFYCRELAQAMGHDARFCATIFQASPMHDAGKIGIPDHILRKPGAHTPEEWEIMKSHAALGATILEGGRSRYMRMGAEIALNHHERWDGGGYPNGLKGEQIPLAARIMQICDVYDALRSRRPYKPAYSHQRSFEIIRDGDGRTQPAHFDPAVLAAFLANAEKFERIFDEYED